MPWKRSGAVALQQKNEGLELVYSLPVLSICFPFILGKLPCTLTSVTEHMGVSHHKVLLFSFLSEKRSTGAQGHAADGTLCLGLISRRR